MTRGWSEKIENFKSKKKVFKNLLLYFYHFLIVFEESCLTCATILLLNLPKFLFYKAITLLTTLAALFGLIVLIFRTQTWQEIRHAEKLQSVKPPVIFLNASRATMTWSAVIAWFWLNYTFKFNNFTNTRWFISNLLSISSLAVLLQLLLYRYVSS
uniref:Uncharacterized protein n=1 Tax=Onchocerca volvulus TaxID=6282 RepID=A0A8R1TP07_ONCVO